MGLSSEHVKAWLEQHLSIVRPGMDERSPVANFTGDSRLDLGSIAELLTLSGRPSGLHPSVWVHDWMEAPLKWSVDMDAFSADTSDALLVVSDPRPLEVAAPLKTPSAADLARVVTTSSTNGVSLRVEVVVWRQEGVPQEWNMDTYFSRQDCRCGPSGCSIKSFS